MSGPRRLADLVDGALVPAAGGGWLDDIEPATGLVHALVPDSDGRDVDAAVAAAKRAFPGWAATPAAERSAWMLRLADAVEADFETFARAESADAGKPIRLARSLDITRAIANLRFFATAILHTESALHRTDGRALNYTLRSPRGVAACISPWNLPLYLFTWKFAPALATGNTVVGKPSELTPLTAHLLAEAAVRIGFPAGVLNILHGLGPKVGGPLVEHPDVPAVSFTGGTVTGATIARAAAPLFKALSLELGGKNPSIVFADSDLDEVVPGVVRAAFENTGQICLCGSRILVEAGIAAEFTERIVAAVRALRVGDPADETTDQGALVSAAHLAKVAGYVELARAEGGRILTGGARPTDLPDRLADGFFLEPTVVDGLAPGCRVNQEEIFGPVATILPFRDEAEALAIANGTRYGLAASLWTNDLRRAHRVAAGLDAGTVWVNTWLLRDLRVPFGGMKDSGVGREGGEDALRFFTESKTVTIAMADPRRPGA